MITDQHRPLTSQDHLSATAVVGGISEPTLNEIAQEVAGLQQRFDRTLQLLDPDQLEAEQSDLVERFNEENFWDGSPKNRQVVARARFLEAELKRIKSLEQRLNDAKSWLSHAEENEKDRQQVLEEIASELPTLREDVTELETQTLFSGEYDSQSARVTIRPREGGEDAATFTQQLMEMYRRWAHRQDRPFEIQESSEVGGISD